MAKYLVHGTTLTVNSVAIAQVRSLTPVKPKRAKTDSTCLDTASETRTCLPGLIDPGDWEAEIAYDPSLAGHTGLETLFSSGDIVNGLITWPDTTTLTQSVFINEFSPSGGSSDDLLVATIGFTVTGAITY